MRHFFSLDTAKAPSNIPAPKDLVYPQLLGFSRVSSRATYTSCLRCSVCEISPLVRYERSCLTSLDRKTILMTWGIEAVVLGIRHQ